MKRRRVTSAERLLGGGPMPLTTRLPHNGGYAAIRAAYRKTVNPVTPPDKPRE